LKKYNPPTIIFVNLRSEENIANSQIGECYTVDGECPEPIWIGQKPPSV